jgi:hypothetical protein
MRLTGQPLSCRHSVPKVETMQNQTKRQKKNIWVILLVKIIFNAAP